MNRHQRRVAGKSHAGGSGAAASLQIGLANYNVGKFTEAERYYRQALAQQPNNPDALHLLGCVYLETDRIQRGVEAIQRAVEIQPGNARFLANLGSGLSRQNRLEESVEAYGRSVDIDGTEANVFNDFGKVLERLARIAPALAAYAHAVMVDGMFAEAHANLGRMLQKLERFDDALVSLDAAVGLRPEHSDTLSYRSLLLYDMKRFDRALEDIELAVKLAPESSLANNIHGSTLYRMGFLEESLVSFDRALKSNPNGSEILLNKASSLVDLHRFEEGFEAVEQAIAAKPDNAEAHTNMGLLCLLRGQFARGWLETEWRWKCPKLKLRPAKIEQPVWLGGESLDGKTIVLHSDQGMGDVINFVRYAPLIAAQGARVVLAVEPALVDLLKTVDGISECLGKEQPMPPFDVHCPMTSLPLAFATELDTIPASVPYVRAPESSKWRTRLGHKHMPRIGLVWSGNPDHGNDHNRSLSFAQIAPLLDLPLEFFSLQKGVRAGDVEALRDSDRITPLGDEISDFADTAALLSEIDLLITADTSIAHLAGALALPVWIMLPHTPDWRWLLGRDDSPWYPSARLFRQSAFRDWDGVVANLRTALQTEYVSNPREQGSSALTARRCNYSLSSIV